MANIKNLFKSARVLVLLAALLLAIIAIHPDFTAQGATIRTVDKNGSAEIAGIASPAPNSPPMSRERILAINNEPIPNLDSYYKKLEALEPNVTIQLKTTKGLYRLFTKPNVKITYLDETYQVNVTEMVFDEKLNRTVETTSIIDQKKSIVETLPGVDIGLKVYEAPKTNIRKGLDLQGGTRVLLEPEERLNQDTMDILLSNMKQRLNVYGLSDIIVRDATDLSGKQYVLVEIAGANEEEVKDLISKQGKFEAKIGNSTIFKGGGDITYVCRSAECAGIDPNYGCSKASDGYACRFRFSISLSPEAAKRQASATKDLDVIGEGDERYLSEKLELFLDDQKVDELNIGNDLKGREVTDIQISGSGAGTDQQSAMEDSLANMKKLQTVLITGSLPVKLKIIKTDSISPVLGNEFVKNSLFMGLVAILAVMVVLLVFYHNIVVSFGILITCVSEVVLLLGFAALVGWQIDLAAIAGIIVAIGTGVDDQIVITDEVLKGRKEEEILDWKKRLGKAFFIIIAAYFATVASMIPLLFAGAGLLKGFALTTIVGVTMGVFVTRPAFGAIIKELLKR